MPIPKHEYESGITDSKVLELFIKNPSLAYGLKELIKQFGRSVVVELEILHIKGIIKANAVINPDTGERDLYFILAKQPPKNP